MPQSSGLLFFEMGIAVKIKNNFTPSGGISFKESDIKKIRMMSRDQPICVVSTVCPDYANDGHVYTFSGTLGVEVSLTAREHLEHVPRLVESLEKEGFHVEWTILVADLPEIVEEEFVRKVAGSEAEYLARCVNSAMSIQKVVGTCASVQTFSSFYESFDLDYLNVQKAVAKRIRIEGETEEFRYRFHAFAYSRAELARKFRGRSLSHDDILDAGAHGMSLYVTHGTLLRKIFLGKNFMVVNHQTPNLQNFYLCNFVPEYTGLLINTPKFPLGVLKRELY